MSENLNVEEYSLIDKVHILAGFLDTFRVLYPQIQDVDFRNDVTQLDVPVYLVSGATVRRRRPAPSRPSRRAASAPWRCPCS